MPTSDISPCPSCHCMTHTIKGRCGKCKEEKVSMTNEQPTSKTTNKILIIGYGEIGKAIGKCYEKYNHKFFIRDLNSDTSLTCFDVIHVALPNTPKFPTEAVIRATKELSSNGVIIIHSTVAPGTTKRLQELTGCQFIVHSPVLGVHPNLHPALMTFKKVIGADGVEAGQRAYDELTSLGMNCEVWGSSKTTELAKLMCLFYRSTTIAIHDVFDKWCEKEGVSFKMAVTEWNQMYNSGYKALGMPEVVRPVCYPPKGHMGGHCQLPAAKILKEYFGSSPFLEEILKME